MDWLILLLLVPAILVPIVLLCGFAGCEWAVGGLDVTYAPTAPPPPSSLKATPEGTDRIKLEWQDTSGGTAKFDILRTPAGETLKDKQSGFVDGGRNDGTDFAYTVTAIAAGLESAPSNESKATTKPNAPTGLSATPERADKIKLVWSHATQSNKAIKFKITHTRKTPLPATTADLIINSKDLSPANTYIHPVAVGSDNEFVLKALVDGFVNSVPTAVESDPSATASAKGLAFEADLLTNGTEQPARHGYCVVQLIPKALLLNSGTKVKITIRGSASAALKIDRIYISQPALSGNPYDPLAAGISGGLTKLVDTTVDVPAGTSQVVGGGTPVPYDLDQTKVLLIAFDISSVLGEGNLRFISLPGAISYARANTKEAAAPNRAATGYTPSNNTLYLIEKIEVS